MRLFYKGDYVTEDNLDKQTAKQQKWN